jgi:PAT family beta-lactamase induction signal transducer AmpG
VSRPGPLGGALRHRLLFAALYLAEGAPIGFLWWALPTRLRAAGMPVEQVATLAAVLAVPWALKFLWAPLVDALRGPGGGLRAWVVGAQTAMIATLLPLAVLGPGLGFRWLVACLVAHAVAAATQDVAVDALCIATTPPVERGGVNGWMQAGMLGGRAVFGGGALMVASGLGDRAVVTLLIAVLAAVLALVVVAVPADAGAAAARQGTLGTALRDVVRRPVAWAGLLFAGVAGAGYEAVGAVAGPYLVDRGLVAERIGRFFAGPAIIAMVVGALAGGAAADRVGHRPTVAASQALTALAVLGVAAVDAAGGGVTGTVLALAALYLAIGLFTASSYALLMDLTEPRLAATQFSAYMGATNGCEAWAGLTVGRLVPALGYPAAFAVLAAVSLAALPLVAVLRLRGRAP